MNKHFMLDIETTGVDEKTDDVLQIGLLEVDFNDGKWYPGRSLQLTRHTDRFPKSIFALENQVQLYLECMRAPERSVADDRAQILDFFKLCGANPPEVYIMGWNAANFDVPFLQHHGFLVPSGYVNENGKEKRVGDTHYRLYEMSGAVALAQNITGKDRNALLKEADKQDPGFAMPEGRSHEALYDCYKQVRTLNGILELIRPRYLYG